MLLQSKSFWILKMRSLILLMFVPMSKNLSRISDGHLGKMWIYDLSISKSQQSWNQLKFWTNRGGNVIKMYMVQPLESMNVLGKLDCVPLDFGAIKKFYSHYIRIMHLFYLPTS